MIVVDTNLRFYLFADSDQSGLAEMVLEKDRDWQAPRLWRSEFRNALVRAVNGRRTDVQHRRIDCRHGEHDRTVR